MKIKRLLIIVLAFLLVGCTNIENNEAVDSVFNLVINEIGTEIKEDVVLPTSVNDISVKYSISDESLLSLDGKVYPQEEDKTVTITIYVLFQGNVYRKTFDVIIKNNGIIPVDPIEVERKKAYDDLSALLLTLKDIYDNDSYLVVEKMINDATLELKQVNSKEEFDSIVAKVKEDISEFEKENETKILESYRTKALDDLNTFFSNLSQEDYTELNYASLQDKYQEAIKVINEETTIEGILKALSDHQEILNGVEKIDFVKLTNEYRQSKKDLINQKLSEINSADYTSENYELACNVLNNFLQEIDKLDTIALIDEALKKVEEDFLNVPVLTLKEKVQIQKDIELKKLNDFFTSINKDDYYSEDYELLVRTYEDGVSAISLETTIEGITDLSDLYVTLIRDIEKKPSTEEIDAYRQDAKDEITIFYNDLDRKAYSEENLKLIDEYYKEAIKELDSLERFKDIDSSFEKWSNLLIGVKKEKTIMEKLFDIEDDLHDIISLSGKTISANINLKTTSLYDSVIIWTSSNEEILSNTGIVKDKVSSTKVTLQYSVSLDGTLYDGTSFDVYVNTNITLPSYYNSISLSLTGAALKKELRTLITSTHKKVLSYGDLRYKIPLTDVDPNNKNNVILFYLRTSVKGTWDGGDTWNREHVWPQSKSWFSTSGAGADIHHLRPSDPDENNRRGNKPYGETNNSTYYCPKDEVKGDCARIIFYLLVRYPESDSYRITNVAQSMDMLLKWNRLDPVDTFEIYRNNKSQEFQGNRNPFIDNADFANSIWSNGYVDKGIEVETYVVEITMNYAIIEDIKEITL